MNLRQWSIIAAVVLVPCTNAAGQDNHPDSQQAALPNVGSAGNDTSWIASGFVGSNFANNAQPASMNFGGSLAYLWKNSYGAEFDTGFTPSFQLQSNFFGLGVKPDVQSYMANAIWSKALGADQRVQPFVSGGAGAIVLRSGLGSSAIGIGASPNDTRFGGDIGGGVMAFAGNWGFKADVRYLRASGSYNTSLPAATPTGTTPSPTPAPGPYSVPGGTGSTAATASTPAATMPPAPTSLAGAVLSGLHFWRANIGVALRW